MKIVTIVGARPQFIKAAVVSSAIRSEPMLSEVLVHTGQHYDERMSGCFFDELGLPPPRHNLGVGSGTHGEQTGRMLEGIEKVLMDERPDWALVYGDTNSTLAGALAAAKLCIPVAHVEAGLRSFNRRMPEEINRVVTDHVSALLLCPTRAAVANLAKEGIIRGVDHVGDVMYDAALIFGEMAERESTILRQLGLSSREYLLATVHRAENTDDPVRLRSIMAALQELAAKEPVIFPVHPRTRSKLPPPSDFRLPTSGLRLVHPLSFLDMIMLERGARIILTDSGGVQKEAYFHGIPCVTLRDETEWVETVAAGWNTIAGVNTDAILRAVAERHKGRAIPDYGSGQAAASVVACLMGP